MRTTTSLFFLLIFCACQRELFFENDTQILTAQFQFVKTGDSCSLPLINGKYQQGQPMNDSNRIGLKVKVSRPGNYLINTNVSNGVYFKDSARFTDTGIQHVTLKGFGTPESFGRFLYKGAACGFNVTYNSNDINTNAVYNIDGSPGNCNGALVEGNFITGGGLDSASHGITLQVQITQTGNYSITSDTINGISFRATGKFNQPGNQAVRLTGSGIPLAAGIYNFNVSSGSGTCSFSVQVSSTAPRAGGVFDCNEAAISGVYQQGTALGNNNTIILPVSVITAGSYSISSIYTNGCVFSGEGFLTTGNQVILLTGTGIPPDSGTFIIPIKWSNDSCAVEITFSAGNFQDYLVCNINGVERRFNDELTADDANLFPGLNSISIIGRPFPGAPEYFSINLNSIQPLGPGFYTMGAPGRFSGSFHKDVGNVFWQPSDLSNPKFTVTLNSVSTTRVEGTFFGQYFDLNGLGSNNRQITSGRFSVRIQ